jgi:hypothetical protein
MIAFYNNLSPTTKLLIQSFLSILGSVLVGVLTAAYQSYTQAGHLDLQALINVSLLTFALLFGKAMHDWIPAHGRQLLQAEQEEKARLYDALQRAQQLSSVVIATQGRQVNSASSQPQIQPPVIVQPVQTGLKPEEIQTISRQIALNLMNMASSQSEVNAVQEKAAPDAYVDPLQVSMKLPAYVPPAAIPDQATQVQQVPFPARDAIMP